MRIVILHQEHPKQANIEEKWLSYIAKFWQRDGHEVVHAFGPLRIPRGDIGILHVDLSKVPRSYLRAISTFPQTLNDDLRDISKRHYSTLIVDSDDQWEGPVIVKTNQNFHGEPERHAWLLKLGSAWWAAPLKGKHRRWLVEHWLAPRPPFTSYPVFPSIDEVPPAWRRRRDLIVERFLPERDGEYYILRKYLFLGSREVHWVTRGTTAVVKASNETDSWKSDQPIPEEVRALRRKLGMDYGKIDFVMHGDQAIPLDVNRTVSASLHSTSRRLALEEWLAGGLEAWLEKSST